MSLFYVISLSFDKTYFTCIWVDRVTNREKGEVIFPMIAFIKGGMTLPMGRITRDYLINHRICPHQCAPNLFMVLGSVDALNEYLRLGLTWHDVVNMYKCHSLKNEGYYLKS